MDELLEIKGLTKSYGAGPNAVEDLSFKMEEGEFLAIIGPSGAGKSTVLRCINRIIEPTRGSVVFEGTDLTRLGDRRLREARRHIGMIFQHYNLVNRLTVLQNVMHGRLGYMSTVQGIFSRYSEVDKQKALKLLKKVGLLDFAYKRAGELSGGQKQRVGIVRALMQEPTLLLCDEPIASLDPGSSKVIMDLIRDLSRERNISSIVNLHQVHVAMEYATRILGMRRGKLVFDGPPSKLETGIIENIYDTSIENLIIKEEVRSIG